MKEKYKNDKNQRGTQLFKLNAKSIKTRMISKIAKGNIIVKLSTEKTYDTIELKPELMFIGNQSSPSSISQ